MPGFSCERVFLPDEGDRPGARIERPVSYESLRELGEFPVIALSVAYEIELAGLVRMLDASGIPAFSSERDETSPFILAGGPLTFSNPLPLAPFVDAIVMGEGEGLVDRCLEIIVSASSRRDALEALAKLDHVFVPALHGETLPRPAHGRRRAAARAQRDSHAAHRALEHVPHRAGARLLARLHLLRDAPLDERRHAARSRKRSCSSASRKTRDASASSARR